MSSEVVISAKNLTKTYRIFGHPGDRIKQAFTLGKMKFHHEFTALKDVSFEIKKGETVGIIGRNGSGKSTLLQLVCGILKPTSGSITIEGRISALLELGAGFNPEFTGRENVYFQGAVSGITKERMSDRFDEIAAFADIGAFIDQPVRMYSSGMFVRLAFATAIHTEPGILVVDEALSVGDIEFAQRCMKWINEFKQRGGTILLVTHNLSSLYGLSDQVIWLSNGVVERQGLTREICEAYMGGVRGSAPSADGTRDTLKISPGLIDQRAPYLNASNLRNDLEIFTFDPTGSAFGTGNAKITNVRLVNDLGQSFMWVVGGEPVNIVINVSTNVPLDSPIVGFFIKNKVGQTIVGDNTFITYAETPFTVPAGSEFEACFQFHMPRLPIGEYALCVAIANGTQTAHVIHHWMHNALFFRAETSSVDGSLVGLPMQKIALTLISNAGATGDPSV